MKKSELQSIIREELKNIRKEANTKIDNYGYAQDYYGVTSDIIETWDSTETITKDIMAFLKAAHGTAGTPGTQHGGGLLVQDIIKAMMEGINRSRNLINKDRFDSSVREEKEESKEDPTMASLQKKVDDLAKAAKKVPDELKGKLAKKIKTAQADINSYKDSLKPKKDDK